MSPTGVPPRVAPPEVPVLTEVVLPARPEVVPQEPPLVAGVSGALPAAEAVAVALAIESGRSPLPAGAPAVAVAAPSPPVAAALPADLQEQIVLQVLGDMQRQVDRLLEFRLRESLAPVLERLADSLVDEVREQLALTLRDVVRRAVAQELARHRSR